MSEKMEPIKSPRKKRAPNKTSQSIDWDQVAGWLSAGDHDSDCWEKLGLGRTAYFSAINRQGKRTKLTHARKKGVEARIASLEAAARRARADGDDWRCELALLDHIRKSPARLADVRYAEARARREEAAARREAALADMIEYERDHLLGRATDGGSDVRWQKIIDLLSRYTDEPIPVAELRRVAFPAL